MRPLPSARAKAAFALLFAAGCRDSDAGESTSTVTATASSTSILEQTSPSPSPFGKAVRFVALGDTGKGNDGARRVAKAIAKKCAADGCDFALLLGDNVYESGMATPDDPLMVERFEKVFASVDAPFYPVLGNHDYGQDGLGTDFARGVNEVLYTQRSTKWKMPDAFYTLSFGALDIFALDTNMANFERAGEQSVKMKAAMQKSRARWKIAYGHHPYMSNGPHGNAGSYNGLTQPPSFSGVNVKTFVEGVVCGNTDAYLCGHDHSMQWLTKTCNGTELLVAGTGAEATTLPGKNETHFQSTDLGFIYGVATDTQLTLEFVNDAGRRLFTHSLQKPLKSSGDGGAP